MKLSTKDVNTDQQLTEEYFYFLCVKKQSKMILIHRYMTLPIKLKIRNVSNTRMSPAAEPQGKLGENTLIAQVGRFGDFLVQHGMIRHEIMIFFHTTLDQVFFHCEKANRGTYKCSIFRENKSSHVYLQMKWSTKDVNTELYGLTDKWATHRNKNIVIFAYSRFIFLLRKPDKIAQ